MNPDANPYGVDASDLFGPHAKHVNGANLKPARVLVIEDDPSMKHMLVSYLEQHDMRVTSASQKQVPPDSLLEESGFEPLVPLQNRRNRGTGPMSPTAGIRVAY